MTYRASPIKRHRRTKAEIEHLRDEIIRVVEHLAPMTLRQLFYQLVTSHGDMVEKTEAEYAMAGYQLLKLRREGFVAWSGISDNTRWVRKPATYRSVEEALRETAEFYRRDLWVNAKARVEVWCEKDALAGVISDVTEAYAVPLYVSRGFASDSYLYSAAESIIEDGRPVFIYEFGDHDPSGVLSMRATKRKLAEFVNGQVEVEFVRAAVTPEQIAAWDLPTRPTKRKGNRHAKGFRGTSVELDTIDPDRLRALVRACVTRHISKHALRVARVAEESERQLLEALTLKAAEGVS